MRTWQMARVWVRCGDVFVQCASSDVGCHLHNCFTRATKVNSGLRRGTATGDGARPAAAAPGGRLESTSAISAFSPPQSGVALFGPVEPVRIGFRPHNLKSPNAPRSDRHSEKPACPHAGFFRFSSNPGIIRPPSARSRLPLPATTVYNPPRRLSAEKPAKLSPSRPHPLLGLINSASTTETGNKRRWGYEREPLVCRRRSRRRRRKGPRSSRNLDPQRR